MLSRRIIFLLVFIILIFLNNACNSLFYTEKSKLENKLLFIEQITYPSTIKYYFVIEDGKIKIYRDNVEHIGNKRIYNNNLDDDLLNEINNRLHKIETLKDKYSYAILDGIQWNININSKSYKKRIILDNYKPPIIDSLFKSINKSIKKNKPKLIMGNPADSNWIE